MNNTFNTLSIKKIVPCEKCPWYKIVIMIFWRG
jgi:hypothetical protein